MTSPAPTPAGFFSGPFEPAETARLLALVEERLARRGGGERVPVPIALVELGRSFATTLDDDAVIPVPPAPLFDVRRGGGVARALKRAANLPLRLFGRPQHHFDHATGVLLGSVAATLRALRLEHARVCEAIERMDDRLALLERRLDERARRPVDPRAKRTP